MLAAADSGKGKARGRGTGKWTSRKLATPRLVRTL
jgi:hypothetical protein